ncbi:UNVERIFIED_ORG: hypothetical protein J2Y81_002139 [Paraburkholderia sediminicola]|jgi:hypothetical protein|uniref:hypothetical protein n=1 Tax=Paraburkholderia aspalathi TaxID=1324617 RepID=UPI002112BFD5|nr:hypothetical protein [Paraburkholderia sediminicola]
MQKHVLTNPIRQAHFFGQRAVESSRLMEMQEASLAGNRKNPALVKTEAELGHWYGRDAGKLDSFAVIVVESVIENNLPVSGGTTDFPYGLNGAIATARAALSTDASLTIRPCGGSEGFFKATVEAQRQTVPFRSPFEHRKPKKGGVQTSILQDYFSSCYMAQVNGVSVAPQRYSHLARTLGTPS